MLSSHGVSVAFENNKKGKSSSSSSSKIFQCSPAMAMCDGMYPPPFPFLAPKKPE